jgi:D-aminoacyl-tRNA deacylase
MNIASSLLNTKNTWNDIQETTDVFVRKNKKDGTALFLWIRDGSMLEMDEVHKDFQQLLGLGDNAVEEVLFLSKHSAASGKKSLTIHPIGIPWTTDTTRAGGQPGRCSPPNPRIAHLYRAMLSAAQDIDDTCMDWDVTLEATHHGPFCSIPAAFVEIGSTEEDWNVPIAGKLWADVLLKHLDEFDELSKIRAQITRVAVLVGGGHYCPKMNDIARLGPLVATGHTLASYTLTDYFADGAPHTDAVEGGWQHVLLEAVSSTKAAFGPEKEIVCIIDKKAFKADARNEMTSLLDQAGLKWYFKFPKKE